MMMESSMAVIVSPSLVFSSSFEYRIQFPNYSINKVLLIASSANKFMATLLSDGYFLKFTNCNCVSVCVGGNEKHDFCHFAALNSFPSK